MKANVAKLPRSRVKITLEVPAKETKPVLIDVYERLAKHVQVTGFRPGKAPKTVILEHIGHGQLHNQVLQSVLNNQYAIALKDNKLVPVSNPSITIDNFSISPGATSTTDLKATIEVDVLPLITIKDYKKFKVERPKKEHPVDETSVNKVIDQLLKQKANLMAVNRASKMGDWVDISFSGYLNGVIQEKLGNSHYPVIIGSNTLMPGFEEKLVGFKNGQKTSFNLTFPVDYFAKEVAGKKAKFEVEVHEVKEVELPNLTDDFAKSFGHSNVTELKESIKRWLESEQNRKQQAELESKVIDLALKDLSVDLPDSLIEQELDHIIEKMRKDIESQGMPFAIYLEKSGKDIKIIRDSLKPQAKRNIEIGLVLGEIVKKEGIDPKSENPARLALDKLIKYAIG